MKHATIDTTVVKKLLRKPEEVIDVFNLVYVNSHQFTIKRNRDQGDTFNYVLGIKRIRNKKVLTRIKDLAIPPAWDEVQITEIQNGHLQAFGRDAKRRKQYRYHPTWKKVRNQSKFFKMLNFGMRLQEIRKNVENDLQQTNWTKSKVIALVVKLMDETHIRIGNEQYAKRNKTYGLSTLRKRHVNIYKDKMKFEFVGKKGKLHSITIRNKKLINLVSRCEEIPGWELFNYFDSKGVKQTIDSGMVNTYLQEITGSIFSAKDFRTWAASIVYFDTLYDFGVVKNKKLIQQNIVKAYDAAARALGNTRNVCKKYYVHPFITLTYENGSIASSFKKIDMYRGNNSFLSVSEEVLLQLLKDYKPLTI